MRLTHRFSFDSAHFLPNYDGKCKNQHGHHFVCKLEISGLYNDETGMICDFKIIKKLVNELVVEKLDHNLLNNIFENPTAENIVVWIFEQLSDEFDKLNLAIAKIELWEGENSSIIFDPLEEIFYIDQEND